MLDLSMQPQRGNFSPDELDGLAALAQAAARAGGEIARAAFGARQSPDFKADGSEVTEHDRAAERAVWETIRRARPNDAFLGEEGATAARVSDPDGLHWIVDPIDGTRNFVRGVPLFACSVAAMAAGEPIVGVIHDPIAPTTYWAARGLGAWRSGVRLPLLVPAPSNRPLVVAIPSAWRAADRRLTEHVLRQHVVRSLGAASLHLALLAGGQIDASILNNTKLWDIAAGCVLVREVGGVLAGLRGEPLFPVEPEACRGAELPNFAAHPAVLRRLLAETALAGE